MKISTYKLEQSIVKALNSKVNEIFKAAVPGIVADTKLYVEAAIKRSSEYNSMINGQLRAELGFINGGLINSVISHIVDTVDVEFDGFKITLNKATGRMYIKIIAPSIEELISLPSASYLSKGNLVDWLHWLLNMGDRIIIRDYKINYDLTQEEVDRSRSGEALMVVGKGWKVPAQYSGTPRDNFITRALSAAEINIPEIVKKRVYEKT